MGQTGNYQWYFRQAIQDLPKIYFKNPWTFMTEADVQCALYKELYGWFYANKATVVTDVNGKRIRDENMTSSPT